MIGIRHYLDFKTDGHGKEYITEPQGFRDAPFGLRREEGRQAVDVVYAGGSDSAFTITPMAQPNVFDRLLMYNNLYSQESEVLHGIEVNGVDYPLGEVDFGDADTDNLNYFTFKTIEIGKKATFKRRLDVPTNLFSYSTIDDVPCQPLIPLNIFAPAKPIVQLSSWKAQNNEISGSSIPLYGQDGVFVAPFPQQVKFGIDNSYAQAITTYEVSNLTEGNLQGIRDRSTLIRAASTLTNVGVKIKNVNLLKNSTGFYTRTIIDLSYGNSYQTGQFSNIRLYDSTQTVVSLTNQSFNATIPVLNNTDKLWITLSITSPFPLPGATPVSTVSFNYYGGELDISVTSTAPSSRIKGARMYDVMAKNAEMVAGMGINAPRWNVNGEFQYEYVTTQNLIRNITDKPFNISAKTIADDYLTFCNGDYQVGDNEVSYLREPDFYQNRQSGKFLQLASNTYRRIRNPKFKFGQFWIGYTSVQSQKENETANTQDEVHYNLKALLPTSKKFENKYDIKIGVIRSAFSFEQARRKAFELAFENKDNAATQDDDKLFSIDVLNFEPNDPQRNQKYTTALQHVARPMELTLTNKGDFSWVLLGIESGDPFIITNGGNARNYFVVAVFDQYIVLTPQTFTDQLQNIAEENTTFTYRIGQSTTLKLRTSEGFAEITGLEEPLKYPNLRYTIARCFRLYYQRMLATAMLFNPFGNVKITEYNNNPNAFTRIQGETDGIKEGDTFKPVQPLLDVWLHEGLKLQMTWQEFRDLVDSVQNERGFVEFLDSEGLIVRGFITEKGEYNITEVDEEEGYIIGEYTCDLEEMYVPAKLELFYDGNILAINGEIKPSDTQFDYNQYQQLSIFNANGKRLYPEVYWNRVSYNGVIPATLEELIDFTDGIQ